MIKTEIKEQEIKDTTNIIDELIFIRKNIIKTKATMEKIKNETNEIKADAVNLALQLYTSKKCHEVNFYDDEKSVMKFLLSGNNKIEIDEKFPVLKELIEIYQKVSAMVGDLSEEETGHFGGN